jgi:hypothetical protein
MFSEKIDFWFDEVKKVISNIIDTDANGVDEWKNIWMQKKADLLPYFNEDGRIEKEIKFESYDDDTLKQIIKQTYNSVNSQIYDTIRKRSGDANIGSRILDDLYLDVFSVTANEVLNNKLTSNFGKFKKGTKTSKAFVGMRKTDYEAANFNEDFITKYVDNYNIAFSAILNSLKNFGKIGLSINPMDFILVSAHTNGWKSCHNIENGCYRTGGISYMLDNTSVVGYAYEKSAPLRESNFASDEIMPLKLWRAMVFIEPEARRYSIISRQYPSEKIIYSRAMRELVAELMATINVVGRNYLARPYSNVPLEESEVMDRGHRISVSRGSDYNYVDPITSHVLLSHFENDVVSNVAVKIGTRCIPCAECGELRDCEYEASGSNYLTCEECDDRGIKCSACGCHCNEDYYYDGSYYCDDCYEELFSYCERCDETTPRDELHTVRNDRGGYISVCHDCLERYYSYCDRCEEYCESVEEVDVNGSIEHWCDSCVSDDAYTCEECGCLFTKVEEIEGDYYCEDCASSKFEVCDRCGEYSSEITSVGGKNYCENCLKQHCIKCAECGEYTENPVFNLCDDCVKNKEMAVV